MRRSRQAFSAPSKQIPGSIRRSDLNSIASISASSTISNLGPSRRPQSRVTPLSNGNKIHASTTASHIGLSRVPSVERVTARTSRQPSYDGIDQPLTHGGDRVWEMTFRPQGRILGVGNHGVVQVSGTERRHDVLRGESSPARKSEA